MDPDTMRERLAEWLPSRLGAGSVTIADLSPPAGNGYSSDTALFTAQWHDGLDDHERRFVARLKPTKPGVFRHYDIDLQYDLMGALAGTGVPVPEVLWREPDPAVLGTPFFVMAHVDGRVPSDNPPYTLEGWILEASEDEQRTLYTSGLDTMTLIHRLSPGTVLVETNAGTHLRRGLDEELAHYETYFEWAAAGRPQPVAQRTWDWLQANRPTADLPIGLSWGDARISNMIFGPSYQPVAVLDWEMASLGDPEMDLGWWLFLDRHFSDGLGVANPPGFLARADTISRWEERVGREAVNLEFWEIYAGFRFAVVMMRIAQLLMDDGLVPPDSDFERNNIVTQLLAGMLGLPHPAEFEPV